jgi:hypothetical protein
MNGQMGKWQVQYAAIIGNSKRPFPQNAPYSSYQPAAGSIPLVARSAR